MREIKAATDFALNGTPYIKGEEIKGLTIEVIAKLNEKGLIEPLTYKELVILERELKEPKKEEIKDGINTK